MPLYTVYLLSGQHWPLSENLCDLWLSLDYTACLCSIYTVFCITADRFCSVVAPAIYRQWRTERKVHLIPSCLYRPGHLNACLKVLLLLVRRHTDERTYSFVVCLSVCILGWTYTSTVTVFHW